MQRTASVMQALILAGGLGTRLRNTIGDVPKVMVPIGGKPFLSYLIDQLREQGFVQLCIAVGYQSRVITRYFKDGKDFGVNIIYSIEDKLLGTGGAIKKATRKLSDEFLVVNGDTYLDIDFCQLTRFHAEKNSLITMALTESKDTNRFGIVELGHGNKITAFKEKSSSAGPSLINAGIYVVNKIVFGDVPPNRHLSFEKEILPSYVNKNFFGLKIGTYFIDIGTPSSYRLVKDGIPGRY